MPSRAGRNRSGFTLIELVVVIVIVGLMAMVTVTKLDFLKAFLFDTGHLVPHYNEVMTLTVAKVMTKDVVHAEPDTPLTRVLELMVKLRTRGVPVIDEGKVVGVISRTDLMHALSTATKGGRAA